MSVTSKSVDDVVQMIRPAVRSEHEYVVGAPPDVQVKLNQNESPFDLPTDVKEELVQAMQGIEWNRYPTEQPEQLIHAIAEHDDVPPESIIVGNGSNELTYTLGLAFVDPGAPVVLPRPMFSLYEKVAHLSGADLTEVGPRDDLSLDTDALVDAVERTEAVLTVLTSPNNPTGIAMPPAEIERVVAASPGVVVVDEAYVEFNPHGSSARLLDEYPNVVILRTLSKAFGLAGVRLGYLIARPEVRREMMKSRLPFMIDRFSEQVGLTLLNRPDLLQARVQAMTEGVATLTDGLTAMDAVEVVPSSANFVLFRTPLSSGELQDRLAEHGVLIRDMSGYRDLEGFVRVSTGTETENKAFLAALEGTLQEVDAS